MRNGPTRRSSSGRSGWRQRYSATAVLSVLIASTSLGKAQAAPEHEPPLIAPEPALRMAPAGRESASNAAPAGRESASNTAPAGRELASNTAPAGRESASNTAPAGRESASNTAPAGRESPDNTASAGHKSASNTASAGRELPGNTPQTALEAVPRAQTTIVRSYLLALESARYDQAFRLLNASARRYYRGAQNYASVYLADGYRVTAFSLLGARGGDRLGRVFYARETARFRDHAHDADLSVTATVPVGVVPESGSWRIKDPGHPWRAFATRASADVNGVRAIVKKISFFARRIEAVVSFVNAGSSFVTILPYGRSVLRDAAGRRYRLIETRDWALTDRTLFEGLRLPPNAQYTGTLAFECAPLDDSVRTFALTVGPLLVDGADAPFAISVDAIAAAAPAAK